MKKLICCCFLIQTLAFGQDRVFFSSFSPETWEIFLSKDDGKNFLPITDHPALDYDAVISPDEKWVVFTSERSGNPQLYVMPIDGSAAPKRLIQSDSFQDQATFSADRSQIAFVGSHEGNAEIYLIDFLPDSLQDISQAKNLTNHPDGDFRPNFSPDGQYLAFSSDRGHDIRPHRSFPFAMDRIGDIYKLHLETGNLVRLTEEEAWDGSPVWSKDGKSIYFYSGRNNNQPAVFQMNSDGTEVKQLSDSSHVGLSPVLISDSKFAYMTVNQEADRIYQLTFDLSSQMVDTLYRGEIDLFNPHRSQSGLWVAHGAKTAKEIESNQGGFPGSLIGAGFPMIKNQDSLSLELTAIRRAFAAPPDPKGPYLVFDYFDQADPSKTFIDGATFWVLPVLILILGCIWMLLRGIYLGIQNRKKISFWKYLLAALGGLVGLMAVLVVFMYFFLIDFMAFDYLPLAALGLCLILGGLALFFYFSWKNPENYGPSNRILTRYLFRTFLLLSILCIYLGFFAGYFFEVRSELYRINYQTLEKESIHTIRPQPGVHPAFGTVIDLKYLPDGSGLVFTTGPFRGDKGSKATVWEYDFAGKNQKKLTQMNNNSGFGDFSLTKDRMVFRSDRDGNFDIFVEENGLLTNLTNSQGRENFPAISPDGNKIVYVGDQNGKDVGMGIKTMDLYLITREGQTWTAPKQITFTQSQTGHPHFSPDGEWVIYTTEEYGINDEQPLSQSFIFSPQMYGEIVALRIRDGKKVKLTHNKWEEGAPLWVKGFQ
ncbi:TolB family protein [Fontibacter flavus]|uniref:TolB family protein n=1 Tax=Fontibacter flavus TaxID=654838 RepID=A0ABV6FQI4_9BACT